MIKLYKDDNTTARQEMNAAEDSWSSDSAQGSEINI